MTIIVKYDKPIKAGSEIKLYDLIQELKQIPMENRTYFMSGYDLCKS